MTSTVYWGSPRQARLEGKETLPAKLDLILERLNLRERVKDEYVAIKLHLGNNLSYSTIHPVFVRKVIQAVKDGGGRPFVVDLDWDVAGHEQRGYSHETLGCPVYPTNGLRDQYVYTRQWAYKNITEWKLGGMIHDATFIVNFAHVKGHPSCSFGAAFKNLALGSMASKTRSQMHDVHHFDRYWFSENCPDEETRKKIIAACPFQALVEDREQPGELHLHFEPCNQCGRCLKVAPAGSLVIRPENFWAFQEAMAISTKIVMDSFEPGKAVHLALATHMTPVCDCFGFTSLPILPDAGIFGSDDIVAIDQAVLDMTAKTPLLEQNIPTSMEVAHHEGHPFAWLHGPYKDPYKVLEYGEALGLGSRTYELVDVLPVDDISPAGLGYVPAA
ncbi:MAG TPA: DUF362 domain-containing protein [Anaerolineaceae bacterium]|nr:DUF362 domain-containing protein [Anaerolineaceae bacterium]HOD03526.1 DUF362 domain-containing protein [Anaerolineaceae bacterium]HQN42582.1 DUF362 domain-containing protein [Anaerolineaceae bacterium]